MTLFEDIDDLYKEGPVDTRAKEVLELLKTQDEIVELNSQRSGEGLYIQYSGKRYFNFAEIAPILYQKYDLVIHGFDKNENGTQDVWLVTKHFMENQT